nr:universal stress protein [Halogeometricum sp. CBA1124]
MYDTILIPTDGSEHAIRAAEHGRYLARLFDATVHVVNVADVQAAAGVFGAGGVDEEFMSRLDAKGEEAIEAVEDALADATPWRRQSSEATPERRYWSTPRSTTSNSSRWERTAEPD